MVRLAGAGGGDVHHPPSLDARPWHGGRSCDHLQLHPVHPLPLRPHLDGPLVRHGGVGGAPRVPHRSFVHGLAALGEAAWQWCSSNRSHHRRCRLVLGRAPDGVELANHQQRCTHQPSAAAR